jgi:hypothetical protein
MLLKPIGSSVFYLSGDSGSGGGSGGDDGGSDTPLTTASQESNQIRPTALAIQNPVASSPSTTLTKGFLRWISAVSPFYGGKMECQFNPAELVVSKEVKWEGTETPSFNAPILQYGGGQSATYSLNLIFDAYSAADSQKIDKDIEHNVPDVRKYTQQLLRLTLRNEGWANFLIPYMKPPLVQFVWGSLRMFWAVITKVEISYIMFAQDGTPIRAKAQVEFTQQDPMEDLLFAQNPTSRTDARKTRIANSHQRLDLIAFEEYGDSRFWRLLADANNLDNPFQLQDGQMLVIPQPDLARFE